MSRWSSWTVDGRISRFTPLGLHDECLGGEVMFMFRKGDFVTINDQIGVVATTGDELPGDLKDHVGVWFGSSEDGKPEVWIIPMEYLKQGPEPVLKH